MAPKIGPCGWPMWPGPKILGQRWTHQPPQASLKQFSEFVVHFLMLGLLKLKIIISQKEAYAKSLFYDWVDIRLTIATSMSHKDPNGPTRGKKVVKNEHLG